MNCPTGDGFLQKRRVKGPSTEVEHCPNCRGIWFDTGEISEVLASSAASELEIPADAPASTSRHCPRCREQLVLFNYPGTLTVIDACPRCRGVWLDARELQEIHESRERGAIECPKCGHRQPAAPQCIACGVVIAKAREAAPPGDSNAAEPLPRPATPPAKSRGGVKEFLLRFIDEMLSKLRADLGSRRAQKFARTTSYLRK